MANTVRLKRSAVQGKAPVVGDLSLGELAVNTYDGKLYMKKNDGSDAIVEIGAGGTTVSATAPSSPSTGDLWYDTEDARTFVWTGTEWVDAAPDAGYAVATTSDSAPANANDGDLWYRTSDGRMYVYYDDGSTAQWVDANPNLPVGSDTWTRTGTTISPTNAGDDLDMGPLFVDGSAPADSVNVDSSGRVGIANTAMASLYAGGDNFVVGDGVGDEGMTIYTGNNKQGIVAFADGFTGAAEQYAGYLLYDHNSDYMSFATTGSERFRIDSSGNMGLGTNVPNSYSNYNTLTLNGTTSGVVDFESNGTLVGQVYYDGTDFRIDARGSTTPLKFVTNAAEAMRIDTSGNIKLTSDAPYFYLSDNDNNWIRGSSSLNAILFGSNNTERMRIDSSGRLLINHTADTAPSSYSSKLQLCDTSYEGSSLLLRRDQDNSSAPTLIFTKTRSATKGGSTVVQDGDLCGQIMWFAGDGTDANNQVAYIHAAVDGTPGSDDTPGRLAFFTTADGQSSATERMRITSSGITFLRGNGDALYAASSSGAGTTNRILRGGHSATSISASTNSINIYTNGDIQNTNNSYGSLSDISLKENIVPASDQWDNIKNIEVVNYNFKEETGHETHKQLGVIAQQVEEVSPGLVKTDEDGLKSVNYSVLYMKSVKALQEAMDRIEALEAQNTDLVARIEALEQA